VAKELTVLLGGAAGQGLQTIGQVISRSLSRLGFHVFALQDYESRIRGGHMFFQLRAADRRVDAHVETVDIVVALDEETLIIHEKELAPHGIIIYDSDKIRKSMKGTSSFRSLSPVSAGKRPVWPTWPIPWLWVLSGR